MRVVMDGVPWLSLRSNHGLQLANAFGVYLAAINERLRRLLGCN